MDILFFVNAVLFGAGLAMDAFSVSVANGLREPAMSRARRAAVAGVYAACQTAMPLTGWALVHAAARRFVWVSRFIPWAAPLVLFYIGGSMIAETAKKKNDPAAETGRLTAAALLGQGIATSLDALSVGFTIAELTFVPALTEALIIGAVTWCLCALGLRLGGRLGKRLAGRAGYLGGGILLAIGVEIFVKGVFFK